MALFQPTALFIAPDMPTTDEILPFLRQIEANAWYTNFGPLVREFESKFTELMIKAHPDNNLPIQAVTVATGYHALAIGLHLMGVEKEDTVLVPAITFPACPLAVQHLGANPLLTDVDESSWTLTPAIAKKIAAHHKIKAVMPVAVYGVPLPAKEWDDFYEETKIPVIIDAAAAIESQRYLRHGLVAHSLHALKPFGIGEGGLLVTANEEIATTIKQYTNFGTQSRIAHAAGENAKMSEYHAAVALAQMNRWTGIKAKRKALYEATLDLVKQNNLDAYVMQGLNKAIVSSFMLKLPHTHVTQILEKMIAKGHAVHRTYMPPLYQHPYYSNLSVVNAEGKALSTADLPSKASFMKGTEKLNSSVLGLPFYPAMNLKESEKAVKELAFLLS